MARYKNEIVILRFALVITAVNVLVATGYSIVGIFSPQLILPADSIPTKASFIFALYAAARTIPLALITLFAIFKRSIPTLFILGILAGCIQFVDTFVGIYQGDVGKSVGPFVIAILQFYALYLFNKSTRSKARKDSTISASL